MATIVKTSGGSSYGGVVAQDDAPTNTKLLWIDTANGSVIKYYDGTSWVTTGAAFS